MTTGQKIAARRKELQLSQEALGDKLRVSRQTVYKWESDLSLPDIDKLVALSRLFQVPVGWLLGVEEEPEPQSVDFSPEQLKLLEEIFGPLSARRAGGAQRGPAEAGGGAGGAAPQEASPVALGAGGAGDCRGRLDALSALGPDGTAVLRPGQFGGQYHLLGEQPDRLHH